MFFKSDKSSGNNRITANAKPNASVSSRIVSERRWVHRNQLEVGMYINELDIPWERTPFMFQGFVIENHDMLRHVQSMCEYANIQSEKLAMVSSNSAYRLVGAKRNQLTENTQTH